MQIIRHNPQVPVLCERARKGFRGGANIDEQGGAIRNQGGRITSDGVFGRGIQDLTRVIIQVLDSGDRRCTAMMSAEQTEPGERRHIPADGLDRDAKMLRHFLIGHVAVAAYQTHDLVLTRADQGRFLAHGRRSGYRAVRKRT
ncbi:hypothetical protein AA3990_1331 [Gluconobacter roseus NBRC 3990]|nr:hypothetical protein AA3990_1331 [Gluconobacter roseus NBRC 3990]